MHGALAAPAEDSATRARPGLRKRRSHFDRKGEIQDRTGARLRFLRGRNDKLWGSGWRQIAADQRAVSIAPLNSAI